MSDIVEHEESVDQATKFDDGKLRYDLLPVEPIEMLAAVATIGAKKYGDHNWIKGLSSERLYAAMMRHVNERRKGNYNDPETGLPHIAHAMWNLMAMLYFDQKNLAKEGK